MKRRILSVICVLALCLGLLPATALADIGGWEEQPAQTVENPNPYTPDTSWYVDHKSDQTYTLMDAADLAGLAYLVNKGTGDFDLETDGNPKPSAAVDFKGKTIYLGADIKLNEKVLDENGALVSGSSSLKIWTAVGTSYYYFNGTFSGKDQNGEQHTISGLYMPKMTTEPTEKGLFGQCGESGTIQDVVITDSYIHGESTKELYVGGIAAYSRGIVENCSFDGKIYYYMPDSVNYTNCGGIVGRAVGGGSVTNCTFKGSMVGKAPQMGGVVGGDSSNAYATGYGVKMTGCVNNGSIENAYVSNDQGSYRGTGGIVGTLALPTSSISDCTNAGEVKGNTEYVGGIIGMLRGPSTVSGCKNTGTVTGVGEEDDVYVGGIAGSAYYNATYTGDHIISDCENSGTVTVSGQSTSYVANAGGIVGRLGSFSKSDLSYQIKECRNTGTVSSSNQNDHAIGSLASATGGIAGAVLSKNEAISQCYNTAAISGYKYVGGIAGLTYVSGAVSIENCYNTGKISASDSCGGIAGGTSKVSNTAGNMTISACYNAGEVSGSKNAGGIVGSVSATTITDCTYWTGCGAAGSGKGLSANAMTGENWASKMGLDNGTWGKSTNPSDDSNMTGYLPVLKNNKQDPAPTLTRNALEDQTLTLSGQPKDDNGVLTTLYLDEYNKFELTASTDKTDATGQITWESSDDAVATVDQSGKVSIQGVGTVTITVSIAADEDYNSATASYSFTVKNKITEVTIQDLGTLMPGDTIPIQVSVPDTAPYETVDSVGVMGSGNFNIIWKEDSELLNYTDPGTFAVGNTYTGTLMLSPSKNYDFAETVQVKLEGVKFAPEVKAAPYAQNSEYLEITISFTAKSAIETADITLDAPAKGETPATSATAPEGAKFTVSDVTWTPNDSQFKGGTAYTASFTLMPTGNYRFTSDTKVTVSGASVTTELNSNDILNVQAKFPETEAAVLEEISVCTGPTQTDYKYGETFDPTGLVLKLDYDDGTTDTVSYDANKDAFQFEPEIMTMDTQAVTVTYGGKTVDISVTVAKAEYNGNKEVTGFVIANWPDKVALPAIPDGASYDAASYDGSDVTNLSVENGVLSYTGGSSIVKDQTYTITVPVSGGNNYEDYNITVTLTGTDKKVPTGAPTLSTATITYGQSLSTITLSGSMQDGENEVAGTFAWDSPDTTPNAGSYEACWTFIPENVDLYVSVYGTTTITVSKATPTGTPKYTAITTSGKTLADAGLTTEGGTFSVPGTVAWELADTTQVQANTAYTWKFTPTDSSNYNSISGSITLYVVSSGGGGSSSSGGGSSSGGSTTTETTKNPDGSTTTTVTNKVTGTVTETTKFPDGSQEVVETQKDGTVTTTTTDTAGNQTAVVEKPDGSSQTTVTNKDGSGSVTVVDADGNIISQATLSEAAIAAAQAAGEAVALPMPAVPVTTDQGNAPTVTVDLPGGGSAKVEIPVEDVTPGTVAVLVSTGGEAVIKTSLMTENGVAVTLHDGDTVKIVDNSKAFDDVAENYWAADAIDFSSSRELFIGTSATTFAPDTAMTRGMIVTVLARMEGVDTSASEPWYETGRQWAMQNGVSDGTNMDQALTREQLATMLWRYVGSPGASTDLSGYTDAGTVSDWATQAMTWCVSQGIIGGTTTTTLSPQDPATRAQVATILMRYIENIA